MLETCLDQPPTSLIKIRVRLGITEPDEVSSCRTGEKGLSRYTSHTGFLLQVHGPSFPCVAWKSGHIRQHVIGSLRNRGGKSGFG